MPPNSAGDSVVRRWFGPQFRQLHPLLQELHLRGGSLRGEVEIRLGGGLAGWLGRRLARSIGVPVDRPRRGFEVEISHTKDALQWDRRFDDGTIMRSTFVPVGAWPDGYWYEMTSALQLRLTVDTAGGGWQWRPLRAYLYGVRLPLRLLAESRAGKRVEEGRYVFLVEFVVPLVGRVLSYGGQLQSVAVGASARDL
jgi:hypothetical protein